MKSNEKNTKTEKTEKTELKTVKEIAMEKGFGMAYKPLTEDNMKLFLMANLDEEFLKTIIKEEEYQKMFLTQILNKRLKEFSLEDKVSEEALFMYIVYDATNPGKAIVFLIALVEFYYINKRVATIADIATEIFPLGFYNDATCMFVIDECMKKRKVIGSEIYISR